MKSQIPSTYSILGNILQVTLGDPYQNITNQALVHSLQMPSYREDHYQCYKCTFVFEAVVMRGSV